MELTIALAVVVPLVLATGMAWIASRRKSLYWSDGLLVVGAPLLVFFSGTLLNARHPDVVSLTLAWWLLWAFAVVVLTVRVLLLDRFIRQSRATSIVLMSCMALGALIQGASTEPLTFGF